MATIFHLSHWNDSLIYFLRYVLSFKKKIDFWLNIGRIDATSLSGPQQSAQEYFLFIWINSIMSNKKCPIHMNDMNNKHQHAELPKVDIQLN